MKKIDKRLMQAYVTTIDDFEIEIRNTTFWEFQRRKDIRKYIAEFEKLINELEK